MNSRVRATDLLSLATVGSRPLRAALSILGIAIGIAAIVGVVGITRSSQADLLASIDRLGTNLLTVVNGQTAAGDEAQLPASAATGIARADGVLRVSATAELKGIGVFRTDRVPTYRTSGLEVRATDATLLTTLDGQVAIGAFLNDATGRYPVVVLGSDAAAQLGIDRVDPDTRIWLGGHWFTVAGVLRPFELALEVDRAALIGLPVAVDYFGFDGHPTRLYVRAETAAMGQVAGMLARAVNPAQPQTVRPGVIRASGQHQAPRARSRPGGLLAVAPASQCAEVDCRFA